MEKLRRKRRRDADPTDDVIALSRRSEEAVRGDVLSEIVSVREMGGLARREFFSGPLPPPALLADYDAVLPGLARTIIAEWQAETRHRRRSERWLLAVSFGGMVMGGGVALTAISWGGFLALRGQDVGGFSVMLGTLAGVVAIFVLRRRHAVEADQTAE